MMEEGKEVSMGSIHHLDLQSSSLCLYEDLLAVKIGSSSHFAIIEQWANSSSPTVSQSQLFDALSHLLLHPLYTEKVAIHFSSLLLDLLMRAIGRLEIAAAGIDEGGGNVLHIYHAMARLLYPFPAILPAVQLYMDIIDSAEYSLHGEGKEEYDEFLLSTYRLTYAVPIILAPLKQEPSLNFLQTARSVHSIGSALLSLRIYANMEAISDATLEELQLRILGRPLSTSDDNLNNDGIIIFQHEEIDAWVFPLQEEKRILSIGEAIKARPVIPAARTQQIETSQLHPNIVSIGGHLFLRSKSASSQSQVYRETDQLQSTLCSFGDKLSDRLPILLSGPEACGKTSLIQYACSLLHPTISGSSQIVTLQLGDQSGIDAKSLLGSFVSSKKTPGSFEWTEGVLTRALRLGKWVVLEDVDRASEEVLSVIKPIVEDMCRTKAIGSLPSLDLGSRGRVEAGRSFALFSTRTIAQSKKDTAVPRATFFGHEHWYEVKMKSLNEEDILAIIKSKNVMLSTAQDDTVSTLVNTWNQLIAVASSRLFSTFSKDRQSSGTIRIPSFHDLLKWCQRIEHSLVQTGTQNLASAPLSNQALQEEIAIEACDIFLGSAPASALTISAGTKVHAEEASEFATDRYTAMVTLLAEKLRVDTMTLWHNVAERRPEFKMEAGKEGEKSIWIGRGQLKRFSSSSSSSSSAFQPISRTFALTAPAARLMEKIAVCISLNEPTLIVGETGTGKTTVVQHLASLCHKSLIALNLSQQTETSDLVGGFKPLDPKLPAMTLHNIWVDLFQETFSSRRNARFLQAERKALQSEKWSRLYSTWKESVRLALEKLTREKAKDLDMEAEAQEEEQRASKTRKLTNGGEKQNQYSPPRLHSQENREKDQFQRWAAFEEQMETFAVQYTGNKKHLVFSFVEGPLVKAIQTGSWVLLDEINLATAETLDCLTALLQSPESSLVLTEKGDLEPISRHCDFRLFACMNPATDVGKKDLPSALRSKFTELYAPSPDSDQEALVAIVEQYIGQEAVGDRGIILDVAQCYSQIRQLAQSHQLADGANQRPHYSIRTLSRALIFAKDICSIYGLRRAVWEGFIMTFTMLLEDKSAVMIRTLLQKEILAKAKNANSAANFVPPRPKPAKGVDASSSSFIQLGSFWIETGGLPLDSAEEYILTPSVQDKLVGLARAVLTKKSPVLIQGPTSAGKTSAIEYLARRTGHKFVRINNHEHTDIQEYIGSYSSDSDSGQLVFHEGLLVTALRNGHWIVLDELNLAPTDVLEALNRLLDDNRELIIPETGQVIKPHSHFMLFATQNPSGLYAGRKVLSRAFRNRFLEIHFQDVPQIELQTILTNRCRIAPSYAEKIVQVFLELQRRRQTERVFDTKQAFVTLRDLFRWGNREADDYQQLAENGFMLLAERARRVQDALVVKQVIEEVINVKIDETTLYDIFSEVTLSKRVGPEFAKSLLSSIQGTDIVWTSSMQRLVCLIASSLRYNEPVLLVGETGSGKTSVCEVLAKGFDRLLITVNCHQSTDTADLIGSQRPLRNRFAVKEAARKNGLQVLEKLGIITAADDDLELENVAIQLSKANVPSADERSIVQDALSKVNLSFSLFEWKDGPLVQAMREGQHLLLDEISLADDSVLERLNSVLEPGRILVLAERSSNSNAIDSLEIKANDLFQVVATMNPGGDYGKKELSPALRNRFTEIWVPPVQSRRDLLQIINSQWTIQQMTRVDMNVWAEKMVDFITFYFEIVGGKELNSVGLRDLIAWARFINVLVSEASMSMEESFIHGAFMTFIDGVPLQSWIASKPKHQIQSIITTLSNQVFTMVGGFNKALQQQDIFSRKVSQSDTTFSIGKFFCIKGPLSSFLPSSLPQSFNFDASTPAMNALRVLRAMQIRERAIMLEGSPGAGKTSLIVALSEACHCKLTRINLSDQTELSDLFGADLPMEGGKAGEFDWRDAAFLQAMQEGSWVLLDEMNLASQSVLEGLNSCLDHRGAVYIPELSRSFVKHPDFRIFAAQNPQHQGGGRKGLPKSFLNRFTKVYVEELQDEDFHCILSASNPDFDKDVQAKMIKFNGQLQHLLQDSTVFSKAGQPWEFNLRDLLRWQKMMSSQPGLSLNKMDPIVYFGSLYLLRFRTRQDRIKVAQLYKSITGVETNIDHQPWTFISSRLGQLGHVVLHREQRRPLYQRLVNVTLSKNHLAALQALGECVYLAWPSILVGQSRSGKTTLVRQLAQIANRELVEVRLNSGTDAIDVIGGFQQVDDRGEATQSLHLFLQNLKTLQADPEFLTTSEQDGQNVVWKLHWLIDKIVHTMERSTIATSDSCKEAIEFCMKVQSSAAGFSTQAKFICEQALDCFRQFTCQIDSPVSGGQFAWIDGPVLQAMRKGSWLLLDDANLCSSSVLDRLNSLLEPNGNLVLSERGVMDNGEIEVVYPHANFRIFFTLDSKYGELSRAMRNRGLEIFIEQFNGEETNSKMILQDATLCNVKNIIKPIAALEDGYSHKRSMLLVLLAVGISTLSLAFVQRLIDDQQWQHVQTVIDDAQVKVESEQLKRRLIQETGADAAFLGEMGIDLQVNPNTYRNDIMQKQFHSRVALLLKSSAFLAHLQNISKSFQRGNEELSLTILQKSSLYSQGLEVDKLAKEDRHLYTLVESIARGLIECLRLPSHVTASVMESFINLFDCSGYLSMKWSTSLLNDYSITKILIGKMQVALNETSHLQFSTLEYVQTQMDAVSRQVTLTSGFAMQQIWKAFLPPILDAEAIDLAVHIGQSLSKRSKNVLDELISNAVDVAATLWQVKSDWSEQDRSELFSVAQRIIIALESSSHQESNNVVEGNNDDSLLLSTLVLAVIYKSGERDNIDRKRQESLVELTKSSSTFPAQVAILFKGQTDYATGKGHRSTLFANNLAWVHHIFKSNRSAVDQTDTTTQDLFRPLLFHRALRHCSTKLPTSFYQLDRHQRELKRLAAFIGTISPVESDSRHSSVSDLLKQSINAVSSILLDTLQSSVQGSDQEILIGKLASIQSLEEQIQHIHFLIDSTTLSPISLSMTTQYRTCLELASFLEKSTAQQDSCHHNSGLAAIRFSLLLLKAYLPNLAIDPLVTRLTEEEFRMYRLDRLQEEKAALIEFEVNITGNTSNSLIEEIDQSISMLTCNSDETARHVDKGTLKRGSDIDLLQKWHREVQSFCHDVINSSKVEEMLLHWNNDTIQGRLLNLQSTICAMLDRFCSIYHSIWDLTRPMAHALSILLLGLGILLHSNNLATRSNTKTRHEQVLDSIVAFPSSLSSSRYALQDIPMRIKADSSMGTLAVPLLLLKVRAVLFDCQMNGNLSSVQVKQLQSAYDQLWYLWTLDEEHEKEQREEEQSLYKVKKLDMTAEDEEKREEEEFFAFFPQYDDIMREDDQIGQSNDIKSATTQRRKGTFFGSDHALQLFQLHFAIFGKHTLQSVDTFEKARIGISESLIHSSYTELSESLDRRSASLQVSLLAEAIHQNQDTNERDFYSESNRAEANKMHGVVDRMIKRLQELIQEWSDQEVLQHIKQRCERILTLDSQSPVNQMLAALEGLLVHTEDWQIYASSKNNLEPQREEIIALIIEWRRLELRGWKGLLKKEAIRCESSVSKMWFTLFQVIVKIDYNEGEEQEQEQRCDQLISLLDQYLRGSTLGQYQARLDLVHSFVLYLKAMRAPCQQQQQRAELILNNVYRFFSQFTSVIEGRLDGKRNIIEKEIADYVKLASWKDTNVHALKVSASKTHRKLHRCLRKYRDALNEAVDPVLAAYKDAKNKVDDDDDDAEKESMRKVQLLLLTETAQAGTDLLWHDQATTPAHLMALPTTLQSLYALYRRDISPLLDHTWTTSALMQLSSTIIAQSEDLAKKTPSIWKKENEKLVKHLETRKRKAWSDLLRELRRIGLTVTSIDGVSSENLKKTCFVYTLPAIESYASDQVLKEADQIHYRLLSLLPMLRTTINSSTRNQDVHVSQLQKGLLFVENCFLASLAERAKMGTVLSQLTLLKRLQERVETLGQGSSSVTTSMTHGNFIDAYSRMLKSLDLWARLQSALVEIESKASNHASVLPFGTLGYEAAMIKIGKCRQEVTIFIKALQKLIDCFQICQSTLMSTEEAEQMHGWHDLFDSVKDTLQNAIHYAPSLRSMCIPTLEWIQASRNAFALVDEAISNGAEKVDLFNVCRQSDRIISSILIIAQELQKKTLFLSEGNQDDELPDRGIVEERRRLGVLYHTLRIPEIQQEIYVFFASADRIYADESTLITTALARLTPFLNMYCIFVEDFVSGCSKWYRGLLKLDLTICKLILSLASNGFCKPRQEEEQSGEAATENDEQLEGGMGLGEGDGAEDVTDTLKDDEMMEELETEEKEDKGDGETKGEKNAREMQDDFEGDMGDVEEGEGEEEGEGSEDENDNKSEVESAVGDVDPLDLDAVDEKTWGGQDEDKKDEGKDKSEKEKKGKESADGAGEESKDAPQAKEEDDKGAEGAGQRGQEGDEREEKPADDDEVERPEGEEKSKDDGKDKQEEEDAENQQGEQEEEVEDQEGQEGEGLGRAIDQEAQQGENLDLDDDLNLEEDGNALSDGDDDSSSMDGLSAMGDDKDNKQDDSPLSADELDGREELSKADNDDDVHDDQAKGREEEEEEEDQVPHGQGEDPMDVDKEEEEESVHNEVDESGGQAKDAKEQTLQQDSGLVDNSNVDDSAMTGDASNDNPNNQQQSTNSTSGRQANANNESTSSAMDGQAQDQVEPSPLNPQMKKEKEEGGGAQRRDGGKEGQEQGNEEEKEKEEANLTRSLGDALQEFKRNMDAIEERLTEEARKDQEAGLPDEKPSEVEHIRNDQDSEMQALSAALEEEALHTLNDVGIEGDQAEVEEDSRTRVDEEMKESEAKEEMAPKSGLEEEDDLASNPMGGGGLMTSDIQSNLLEQSSIEVEDEDMMSEKSEEEMDAFDEAIESQMNVLFSTFDAQQRLEVAQELWKAYLEATADYAFTLSEQLRLILAPTKATKLTGDFKTGKRLNMRKIIPFIASDYLKDKIWLRRNLPQKREYQVLLSIDDSKSMLESKNMLLAFKSLALVCSALDKLEVGQIGVLKFGKEIELLKGFEGETIREQDGGKILERLQFQQKGTDVSAMLQTSFKILTDARENQSTTSSQLWQLQIIISDGICQDHQKLQSLLRRASEERIMVVFVILDSLQQNSSILTMNSVQYTMGANGRPHLQMTRYLDTFPFEYFVVVRDVADLPDVLSTTLRQWAQKIAEA